MEPAGWSVLKEDVPVHLVQQNSGPHPGREIGHLAQDGGLRHHAAGIVGAREDQQLGAPGYRSTNRLRLDPVTVLESPRESLHRGAQGPGQSQKGLINRLLHQDLVAGLQERRACQEVGP